MGTHGRRGSYAGWQYGSRSGWPVVSCRLADPFDTAREWVEYARSHEAGDFYWEARYRGLLAISISLEDDRRLDFLKSLLERMREKIAVFKAIGKFVPTSRRNPIGRGFPMDGRVTALNRLKHPDNREVKQTSNGPLCHAAFSELRVEDATELAWILAQRKRKEAIPALRQLLNHPSETVAKQAAEGLVAMGENAEIPEKSATLDVSLRSMAKTAFRMVGQAHRYDREIRDRFQCSDQ